MIDVVTKVFDVILQIQTSALTLITEALSLDVDGTIRYTTYVAHWSSVGASRKLLLCASLVLLMRAIPWTGAPFGG